MHQDDTCARPFPEFSKSQFTSNSKVVETVTHFSGEFSPQLTPPPAPGKSFREYRYGTLVQTRSWAVVWANRGDASLGFLSRWRSVKNLPSFVKEPSNGIHVQLTWVAVCLSPLCCACPVSHVACVEGTPHSVNPQSLPNTTEMFDSPRLISNAKGLSRICCTPLSTGFLRVSFWPRNRYVFSRTILDSSFSRTSCRAALRPQIPPSCLRYSNTRKTPGRNLP